jgi:membrane-associated protein
VDFLVWLADLCLHIDRHLGAAIVAHGQLTYGLLFLIVFLETGLVITPFLPGDSLIFAAGSFAGLGSLNLGTTFAVLTAAAILGDTVNYAAGSVLGHRVERFPRSRWFNPEHLMRTRRFFDRYGPKTIVIARFVPIVRTFAPFVAGVAGMRYRCFVTYNVAGAILWVGTCLLAGYFFGTLPFVRDNFGFVVVGIVLVSLVPAATEYIRYRRAPKPVEALQ